MASASGSFALFSGLTTPSDWDILPPESEVAMRLQMVSEQATKDALAKAKSEILFAIRKERNPQIVDCMEFIAGKIEALQSRIKP